MLRFLINFKNIHHVLGLIKCYLLLFIGTNLNAQTPLTEAFIDKLSQQGTLLRFNKKLDAAIKTHHEALLFRQQLFGAQSIPVANSLTNLGHCFYDKMQWDSAVIYYINAVEIEEKTTNLPPEQPFQIGDTYRCLADAWIQKGDFLKAQSYIKTALSWLKTENSERLAAAFNTQGQCFSYLGDIDAAIDAFKQAIQTLPESTANTWIFYTNLGDACAKKQDEKALIYLNKALDLMPNSASFIEKAQLYNKLGDAYFIKNEYDLAQSFYQKALNLTSVKNLDLWANAQINLAKTERQKGNISAALSKFEACLNSLNGNENYPLEKLMALTEYAKTLFDKAFQSQQKSDWQYALLAYEKAIQFGEIYENRFNQAKSALILRGYFYERYGGAAEVCAQLGQFEKAFLFSEQSKAYLLKHKNKVSLPSYSTVLKEVRSTLKNPQTVLLEYCFGRRNLLLFKITSTDFSVKIIPTKGLQDSVMSLHSAVSNPFYNNPNHYFADAAHALFQQLIQPAELPNSVPLMIVPDGILHYLPFDILLKDKPKIAHLWQHYKPLYLLSEHAISYKFAALLPTVLKEKASKELLSFAPVFEQHPRNLQTLRFNKTEVETIQKSWKSQLFIGSEASKKSFTQLSPQYRMLHLSTHGIANDIYPDNSFLAFTFKNEADNGVLTVEEISHLDLKSELVSLSACQTASGTFYGGEGLMSIAHAFLTAGSQSVLASLWDVNEGVTKDLMALFYDNLRKGMSKDEALRQAKLSLITDAKDPMTTHPYFWSAFTIVGEVSPIEKGFSMVLWLFLSVLIAFIILAWFRFKKG